MTAFAFDTAADRPELPATTSGWEPGQNIRITSWQRSRTIQRKIEANIQTAERVDELDAYWQREDLMLDALHLFDPEITSHLRDVYETHRACLLHGGAERPCPAEPGNAQSPQSGKTANPGDLRDEF